MTGVDELFRAAWAAREHARPVLSGYKVGAAVLAKSGKVYTGSNIETGAAKVCLCAETCALYKALSEGETAFVAVVVVAEREDPIPPCGHCRQILSEFAPGIVVHSENREGDRKRWNLRDLLPEAYSFGRF